MRVRWATDDVGARVIGGGLLAAFLAAVVWGFVVSPEREQHAGSSAKPTEVDGVTGSGSPTPVSDPLATRFHPSHVFGLPARYVASSDDGVVWVVETRSGAAKEIFRAEAAGDRRGLQGVAVSADATAVYVGYDGDKQCEAQLLRIALDTGVSEHVAAGVRPVVSPDGRWLVYAIDGYKARGERPPEPVDPSDPCRDRYDSYAWHDLETGDSFAWVGPTPEGDRTAGVSAPRLAPIGFDPSSTTLLLDSFAIDNSLSFVTATDPAPHGTPAEFSDLEQALSREERCCPTWLPDGTFLLPPTAAGRLHGDLADRSDVRVLEPPAGYSVAIQDASDRVWWTIGGWQGNDVGSPPARTWAWNHLGDELVLLADNADVRWIPDTSRPLGVSARGPVSQTLSEAARDGVPLNVAALTLQERVQPLDPLSGAQTSIEIQGERWLISRHPYDEHRCERQWICDYSEILRMRGGAIVKAYPMPEELPPHELTASTDAVYCARQGDGGLPSSMVCRIDLTTGSFIGRAFPHVGGDSDGTVAVPNTSTWTVEPVDVTGFDHLRYDADLRQLLTSQLRLDPHTLTIIDIE